MVRLWYSNHLEELVDALVEQIEDHRANSDPFEPVKVVVPNRNLATFLKFEIARKTGITANVQFDYLNRFFHDLIPESSNVEILDRNGMHAVLIDTFADPALRDRPELAPIFDYIDASDDEDGRSRRRFQLAQQVGRVFEEYTLSRPRMLQTWRTDSLFDEDPWKTAEAWQRALWLEVFGPEGRIHDIAEAQGKTLIPMGELASTIPVNQLDLPPRAHIFGLSYVARIFYDLFYRVSSLCELNLYTLNPCMEYWEDVPSGWRVPQRDTFLRRHAEHATLAFSGEGDLWEYEEDVAPLRLWGRPGRDNVRLLNILTNCDFEARYVDPLAGGDTLLHRIQRDILTRQPARTEPEFAYQDDSIQVLECPTIQREIESVANSIWRYKEEAAARGESLAFNDIAVIVSARQREAYQARIRSVFQNTNDIPHNIVDISASAHRRFLEAVQILLHLPFGEFARNELLKLVTHPNVLTHVDGADRATWVRWVDELSILFGADRSDLEDTYVKEDLYTWDQGLRRLALGVFMAGDLAGERRWFDAPNGFGYVPYELGQQDAAPAGELIALVRGLIADARAMREQTKTLREWMDIAATLVSTYLEPENDDDTYERGRVLEAFRRIAELDLTEKPIPYRIAWEFVADRLGRLEISRGQYLAEGVVVSSFLPMRPIPFKVVFVTGMGEKFFPRSETRSPLDLRWAQRQAGDVFSTRDQDEYMFLETLISTRQKFVCSYVSRDAQTGEKLEPSPVVRELLFMVERGYTDEEGRKSLIRTMPLRRWKEPLEPIEPAPVVDVVGDMGTDDIAPWEIEERPEVANAGVAPGVRAYQPEAQAEARARALRDSLDTVTASRQLPTARWSEFEGSLAPDRRAVLRETLGVESPPERGPSVAARSEITLHQMRNFLRSPLQGSARFFLGMRDEVFDDPMDVTDEHLQTEASELFFLLRTVFGRYLASAHEPAGPSLASLYDEETRRRELRGELPTGLFREAEREKHLRLLGYWRSNLTELGVNLGAPLRAVAFGGRLDSAIETQNTPAIQLTVDVHGTPIPVRLVGRTTPFDQNGTSVQLVTSKLERLDSADQSRFFRGFLDAIWLAASESVVLPSWRVALVTTGRGQKGIHLREFRWPDPGVARSYLTAVAQEMLGGMHAYRMPMMAAWAWKLENWLPFHERLDKYARDNRDRYESFWGPVREPERYGPATNPEELFQRRFGVYFEHVEGVR